MNASGAGPGSPRALGGPVILFDGVCNLCHGTVQFVIRRDPAARFRFASLQSTAGLRLGEAHGVDPQALDSMLLLEHGRLYRRSTAALRIARGLRPPWPLAYALIAVPAFLRDALYDFVGRRRYRWFGKREHCAVSEPAAADRFLT